MSNKTVAEALIRAQKFEDDENYEQAYECYKYAYELNPQDTETIQKLATAAQILQHNDDAITYWNKYMEIKPEDPISYTQLLDLYFHENKYQYYMTRAKLKTIEGRLAQAVDDYKKALNNTTDEKDIIKTRYLVAQTYEIINKPFQAIDEYLRILDYDHNESVYLSLANLYYKEDKAAALNILNQALEHYPESKNIKEFLCTIHLATGDYAKAEKFAINKYDKIKSLLMQDKNQEAIDLLTSFTDKDKKDPRYFALMAEYYYNIEDDKNTLEYISLYEKTDPSSPLPSQMRALVYEKTNNDFEAHFNWGKYYIKKNNHELALDEYLNAYNANPNSVEIIRELINLYTALNDEFAAAEFCEKLVKIEKNDIATLKRLVKFYEKQGYEEKVMDYLYAISEINNKDYETLLKLAQHAEKNKKTGEAIDFYEKYVKFAPNSDEKEQIKSKLQMLTSGEIAEEESLLDKILGFFTKK